MVADGLRAYVEMASGLTELTVTRAREAAASLVAQGMATAGQVQSLADDLLATSRDNRAALLALVRHEVEQSVRRVGLARREEVRQLTERVRELEATLRDLRDDAARRSGGAPAKKAAAKKAPAKKPVAKKSVAKKSAARKTTPRKAGS